MIPSLSTGAKIAERAPRRRAPRRTRFARARPDAPRRSCPNGGRQPGRGSAREAPQRLRCERDLGTSTIARARARAPPRRPAGTPRSCRSRSRRRGGTSRRFRARRRSARGAPPAPRERLRSRLGRERLRPSRRLAPLRRAGASGDERQAPRRSRPVVVGEPEREVDEAGRDRAEHRSTATGSTSGGASSSSPTTTPRRRDRPNGTDTTEPFSSPSAR
jgi:hypothetical protein